MVDPTIAAEIKAIACRLFERQEFKHYKSCQDEILSRLLADGTEKIKAATEADAIALHRAASRVARESKTHSRRMMIRMLALSTVLISLIAGSLFFSIASNATLIKVLAAGSKESWIARDPNTLIFLSWAVTAMCTLALLGEWLRGRATRRAIVRPVKTAADVLERSLASSVQEALSAAINSELGPRGIIAFPTHAPRLVELDVAHFRQSRTTAYIKEFILEHEASAVGLAGTRGSGKSTVMRSLVADPEIDGPVIIVPSPVRYDAGEFIRVLLGEIAAAISQGHSRPVGSRLRGAVERTSARRLLTLVGVGVLAGVLPDAFTTPSSQGMSVSWLSSNSFGGLIANVTSILLLTFVAIIQLAKVALRLDAETLPPDIRQARELLRELRWETEQGTTTKSTLKVRSFFETSGESSIKLKSRAMTRSELVSALRDLLKCFARHTNATRMVICIDELDKINDPDHLVAIVNELKDLFHIQKVHFLVTVSTDALDSFEQRGLAGRDAFDSSFDTVVHTNWLTLDESLDVTNSRCTGFPPIVAMLCHAWSGGLARDLLRAARGAVELQRRTPNEPLSVDRIIRNLVFDDLEGAVRASMRGLPAGDEQLDGLWLLHQCLSTARRGDVTPHQAQEDISDMSLKEPALQALLAKARIGLSLLRIAGIATSLPDYWLEDGKTILNLRRAAEEHAEAIKVLGEPTPILELAVQTALHEFDPAILR
ncbi:P-loop NTPase fold protein [Amycolatopsis umgeniensis]|uniref:Energy-coupling factor transporter ATP-binding protein EcfA2 n=1 Tax=Amycolatopsis umgeniensis TaxID=336628 RepID=A0A841ASD5_9PSEU|nr:P-loop NTPase fold protein [Amycolatopsis umgeniensis]MBB5851749.1 energy-coupling factor transporter ATP-binding protein EcfA2 [Amycolatopsis umgeniensis]